MPLRCVCPAALLSVPLLSGLCRVLRVSSGALVGADEDWSVDLWRSILDPLLVAEGDSHGTQHWSLEEWRAALSPLLDKHKRKSDPLLSAGAARKVCI